MKRLSLDESYRISNVMEEWLQTYKATRVVSKTTGNYRFGIQKLIGIVGDLPIEKLSQQAIDDFKISLLEKDLSVHSINSYLRCVRTFVNWLIQKEQIRPLRVTLLRAEKSIKDSYTEEELMKLLVKPSKRDFSNYRNWVAINVLIGTGCRRRTLVNIKVSDIDFMNNFLSLRITKSRNAQINPLSQTLASVLKEYVNARKAKPDDYLICNAFGGQMLENGLTHEIQKYNWKRGVKKSSLHLFRHTFARMYLQAGGNVVYLSRILGHQSITTTMEYVYLFADDLKVNFDAISPLEQMQSHHRL